MTAICKLIPIHSKNVAPIIEYIQDNYKTDIGYSMENSESDYMQKVFDYTENPLKTQFGINDGHEELLISGVNCDVNTAVFDFAKAKEKYLGISNKEEKHEPFLYKDKQTGEMKLVQKEPVQAIHLIQSFAETDIDPRLIHQIGVDLVKRMGLEYQAVVSTHMNKEHIHNHIVVNSYLENGKSKIPCNRKTLLQIRELSDELQREYGIEVRFASPEQQLRISKEKGRHSSYQEWKQTSKNNSWKLQMMNDIAAIRQICSNKEEFIELMNDYGYTIARESDTSITWMNHEIGKKIRDTTLGQEFTIGALFSEQPAIEVKQVEKINDATPFGTISVAKYDFDGRKRSELEMLIRKAIAIIQKVRNAFEKISQIETTHTPKYKLQLMDEALTIIRNNGIENKQELQETIQQTVSTYNHYKSSVARMKLEKDWYSSLSTVIKEIELSKELIGGHLLSTHKSFLHTYSPEEVRLNRAKLFPMSDRQKKELYYKCNLNPDWYLAYKFEELSSLDAKRIIDYFDGRGTLPSDLLLTLQQHEMKRASNGIATIYKSMNEHMKVKYGSTPITVRQQKEITTLLESHGYMDIDTSKLTYYDVLNIRNCFMMNPFQYIPINYQPPTNHKSSIEPAQIERLEKFMQVKNITSAVPLTSMSNTDFNRMFSYVISSGNLPDCLKPSQKTHDITDIQFDAYISDKPIEQQVFFSKLRNQMNYLSSIGIDPYNLDSLKEQITNFQTKYENATIERDNLGTQYKELLKLQQAISYAEMPSFIYGPMWDEKKSEPVLVQEKEECDTKSEEKQAKREKSDLPKTTNPFNTDIDI